MAVPYIAAIALASLIWSFTPAETMNSTALFNNTVGYDNATTTPSYANIENGNITLNETIPITTTANETTSTSAAFNTTDDTLVASDYTDTAKDGTTNAYEPSNTTDDSINTTSTATMIFAQNVTDGTNSTKTTPGANSYNESVDYFNATTTDINATDTMNSTKTTPSANSYNESVDYFNATTTDINATDTMNSTKTTPSANSYNESVDDLNSTATVTTPPVTENVTATQNNETVSTETNHDLSFFNTTSDYGINSTTATKTTVAVSGEAASMTSEDFKYKGVSDSCLLHYNNCTSQSRDENESYCLTFRRAENCVEENGNSTVNKSCTDFEVIRLQNLDCGPFNLYNISGNMTIGEDCEASIIDCLSRNNKVIDLGENYPFRSFFCDVAKTDESCFFDTEKGTYCTEEEYRTAVSIAKCSSAWMLTASILLICFCAVLVENLG